MQTPENNEMKSGDLLPNDVVVILRFYVEGIPSTVYIKFSQNFSG